MDFFGFFKHKVAKTDLALIKHRIATPAGFVPLGLQCLKTLRAKMTIFLVPKCFIQFTKADHRIRCRTAYFWPRVEYEALERPNLNYTCFVATGPQKHSLGSHPAGNSLSGQVLASDHFRMTFDLLGFASRTVCNTP